MGQASLTCEQIEFLLEINDPDNWVNPGAAWDTANWDEDGANWVEDEGAGWVEAAPYNRGFNLERGRQTSWDDLEAARIEFELDNRTGVFSIFGSEAWPRIRIGMGVRIYGWWDGVRYPIFVGQMTEWREAQEPYDFTVRAVAYDVSRTFADPIDVNYHAGTDRQLASDRIRALFTRVAFEGPQFIMDGEATMTNYLTTRSVLEEIKLTAASDGGVFFVDNDGTVVYMDRNRYYGRPTDGIPVFGDGCNDVELPYAAIEPVLGDQEFGNVVLVSNVSQGTDIQYSAKAVNQQSIDEHGVYRWSPPQLVICNADHVQSLADFHLLRRSVAYYRINSFECYPIHDDKLWPALLALRIMDLVKVLRRPPDSAPINANMLVDGMRIEATPEMWKWSVRCSPGTIEDDVPFWDFDAFWDETTWL